MPAAPRRSSLTFKGPAQPTRTRKAPVTVDPIVPRASKPVKKRRRSSGADSVVSRASTSSAGKKGTVVKRAANRPKRESGASDASEKKAPAKRRRRPEPVEEDEHESEVGSDEGDDAPVRAYERRVSRDLVAKRWRLLSSSARDDLRFLVERAGRDALDEVFPTGLSSKAAQGVRKTLASFADDFDTLLTTLPVPPLPTALAGAARGKGKAREVDISRVMAERELRGKVDDLQRALEAEEADVEALQARVDEERSLLEQEETLLADFLSATQQLSARRKANLDEQAAHPLVAPLLASRLTRPVASTTAIRIPDLPSSSRPTSSSTSRAWLSERALTPLTRAEAPPHTSSAADADAEGEAEGADRALAARVRRALMRVRGELDGAKGRKGVSTAGRVKRRKVSE